MHIYFMTDYYTMSYYCLSQSGCCMFKIKGNMMEDRIQRAERKRLGPGVSGQEKHIFLEQC